MPPPARDLGREARTLTVERLDDGVVVLSFYVGDHRQNVITEDVLRELAAALDAIDAGPEPRGVVVRSARTGSFFAGADIARLQTLKDRSRTEIEQLCAAGRGLFGRLSERPWPSLAVIDGTCLGGGLELALGCDLRIATSEPHTVLGLPEVKLGLLPGWGGTVRLARLIGPGPAVELAATGETIDGPAAARIGLVDACVPATQALESARRLIDHHAGTRHYRGRRYRQADAIDLDPQEQAFLEATSTTVILGRTGGHYPAPPTILATILAGATVAADEAGRIEGAAFATLAHSPVATQLVRVFRLGERNRHDSGIDAHSIDTQASAAPPLEQPAVARTQAVYDVVGPVCESGDWIGRDRALAVQAGDQLAVLSAGAYCMSMASNYNTRGRAAELLIDGDKVHVIRERESSADQMRHERLVKA